MKKSKNNSWKKELDNILGDRKEIIDSLQLSMSSKNVVEALGYFDKTKRQLMNLLQTTRKEARMETLEQVKKEAKNCIQYDCEVPFVSLSEFTTFFGKLQSLIK